MKTSSIIIVIIFSFLMLGMIITNPPVEQHRSEVADLLRKTKHIGQTSKSGDVKFEKGQVVDLLVGTQMINTNVTRTNLIFLSLTTFELGSKNNTIGIGIFGSVFIFKQTEYQLASYLQQKTDHSENFRVNGDNQKSTNDKKENSPINKISSNLNQWLKITTGYKSNFRDEQINFNTINYSYALQKWPNTRYSLEDDIGTKLANERPIINIRQDNVKLTFKGIWIITIFATSDYFIYSIHHGSSGESNILNLKTGEWDYLDYEIVEIKNNIASVMSSSHSMDGEYLVSTGFYNLYTKKIKWK